MKIDVHAHTFPGEYLQIVTKALPKPPPIKEDWQWNEDRYLKEMDQWGIDMQVLSLAPPSVYCEDVSMVKELCRVCNDRYGEICSRRPDRFRMFASLPIVDVQSACVELERAKTLPGFSGIALGSNILGKPLDDPAFSSFFDLVDKLELAIFMHPIWRPLPEAWHAFRLHHLIGLPVDTTFAVTRLMLSGFFDRHPRLHLIAAHVGGTLPYLSERIERAFREGRSRHKPSFYLRKIYYDTAGPTHEAVVACVAKMFGSEQVVFGSDFPFGLGQEGMQYMEKAVSVVDRSELSEIDRERIFSGNLLELLHIAI
jgi:aminocarboxymuconate-semialdehyde decarboxylase